MDLPGGSVISTGVLGVNCALMFATLFKKKDAKSPATSKVVSGRGGGRRRDLKVEDSWRLFGIVNFLLIKHNFSRCDLVSEISE